MVERSFAHCYDTGGMRRTHLRKHNNILKRQLIHVAGFNLSLIFRRLLGAGTPREWNNLGENVFLFLLGLFTGRQGQNRRCRSIQIANRSRRSNFRYGAIQVMPGIRYLHHGQPREVFLTFQSGIFLRL